MRTSWSQASIAVLLVGAVAGIQLDVNDPASLASAAKAIVAGIVPEYNTGTPGLLSQPYYWWTSGLGLDSLVNYWALTNDSSYVDFTRDGLLWQAGTDGTFMPVNQTKSIGNDDQATWALAAMTAAENGFPAPSVTLSWVQIAQNVFDLEAARWDSSTCNGGLRWQIFTFNAGYNYKNALANGDFMQLAARLARFTGNQTYADWAQRTLDWMDGVGMIDDGTVYDGTVVNDECANFDHSEWTANYGTVLSATSYMVNLVSTQDQAWVPTTSSVFQAARAFFTTGSSHDILYEATCQPSDTCTTDTTFYRAILARALANQLTLTTDAEVANGTTHSQITAILQASAVGAAAQCSTQDDATTCAGDWTSSVANGSTGVGQSLSALEVILANLPRPALLNVNNTASGTPTSGPDIGNATASPPAGASGVALSGASMAGVSILAVLGALASAMLL